MRTDAVYHPGVTAFYSGVTFPWSRSWRVLCTITRDVHKRSKFTDALCSQTTNFHSLFTWNSCFFFGAFAIELSSGKIEKLALHFVICFDQLWLSVIWSVWFYFDLSSCHCGFACLMCYNLSSHHLIEWKNLFGCNHYLSLYVNFNSNCGVFLFFLSNLSIHGQHGCVVALATIDIRPPLFIFANWPSRARIFISLVLSTSRWFLSRKSPG